ncbi:M61 family metallopeptidase [Jiulongibacter sediminis]|jgi:predicted metalloprotease with PDZ domain|uniref:M61 family metallopeptidase n=1 Tax=Jiulongibacter sediminis TaxID=1605367 RepID=UPI0026F041DC|nr:PDZ domain-containing protein [Jiulongibacter sediminis]
MLKTKSILFSLVLLASACKVSHVNSQDKFATSYELKMPHPETHYFEVTMNVNDILTTPEILDKDHLLVKMAVWTPGSYLIREFARNVQDFEAKSADGKPLKSRKINKNTWEIELDGTDDVKINYLVYANELTVRTSFIDAQHGYANGASVFLYLPQTMSKPSKLTIYPNENWSTISTALPEIEENTYVVKDFDTLVDSPIEIGNHEVLDFEAAGVPHKIAMFTTEELHYDKEKLLSDYAKMVEAATGVFGETPLNDYLFIVQHQPGIGGGLEHLFSTTCQTRPSAYDTESGYKGLFGLLAHEYFHLWNVKRVRPIALGPFDYENENYTHLLWVAEGFTNYYEEVILSRAGIYSEEDILNNLAGAISNTENTPGNKVQAVTDASWDAWIKYYRPDENSGNSRISYYGKGGVLAALLNAKIIANSNSERSLDDVMQLLYQKYYKELGRGFTDEEFQTAVEEVYGGDLDYFFENYVFGTETPDYAQIYKGVGIELINLNEGSKEPYLGITERGGYIYRLSSNGSAYNSGLNVGDKLVSIDGRSNQSFSDAVSGKSVGDILEVKIERHGNEMTFNVPVGQNENVRYQLTKASKLSPALEKAYHRFVNH